MFLKNYKNTLKTLFRSKVFIILIILVLVNVVFIMSRTIFSHWNGTRAVYDTEPVFVLIEHIYRKLTFNALHNAVMLYAIPLLCVFSVFIILKNDFGCGQFEIEKACGNNRTSQLFGRISAIIVIDLIVATVASYLAVWWYCGTRRGVEGWTFWKLLSDSGVRVIRIVLICELPAILLCVAVTYFIGTLLKSALAGGAGGALFVVSSFVANLFFRQRFKTTFVYKWVNYLRWEPYTTLNYFDTDYANDIIQGEKALVPINGTQIAAWVGVLVGIAVLFIVSSYFLTNKRNV